MPGLQHGPLNERSVHLCIDMQRIFSTEGPWPTPWMERVLPNVARIVERVPEQTIFTRFITPQRPEDMPGTWRQYYERWRQTTREQLDPSMLELMPPLGRFVPPATVIDKPVYSAFAGHKLAEHLHSRGVDTLVVTGSETDVCVLATVLGAVDHGYRVVVVADCLCSSSDEGHDTLLSLYSKRFSQQIETADSETVLSAWQT
jgi:nicotinamidase-related amidase